jgi:hypothetical protein
MIHTLTEELVRKAMKAPIAKDAVCIAFGLSSKSNPPSSRTHQLEREAVRLGIAWPFKKRKYNKSGIPQVHAAPPPVVADLVHCIVCGSGLDITRSGSITCLTCKALLTATVEIHRFITLSVKQ